MNPDEAQAEAARAYRFSQDQFQQMNRRRQTQVEFQKSHDAEMRQKALKRRGRR